MQTGAQNSAVSGNNNTITSPMKIKENNSTIGGIATEKMKPTTVPTLSLSQSAVNDKSVLSADGFKIADETC